jgi:predicted Zn finger-like uncharacterized protein
MIISCPSCSTHYNFPDQRLSGDGMAISCSACGHSWIESRAIEIVDISPRKVPTVIEHGFEPDSEVKRLVEASRRAKEAFAVKKRQRLGRLRGWAILGACLLAPVAAAASFPELVVRLAPVTVRAYDAMGYNVNIYGLEIRRIEQQHAFVDGLRVLSIKGEISNISNSTQKIPWLRFGLNDRSQAEVYTWTLDTGVRPLRAGESTSFVTRVASPPESAKNLQIRFAHRDEIGSNPSP